jgi:hypothetical protein
MELLDYPIDLESLSEKINIHLFGDIHRAALGCDAKQLRSDVNQIKVGNEKGERHLWVGMGDWCNSIGPKDKRHDSAAVAPEFVEYMGDDLFRVEASALASEFKPIAQYGIGMITGNHEDGIARRSEYNPARDIAERLDIPYLGYSAIIRFRLRHGNHTECVIFHLHHGTGASRTKGGKMNMLYNMRDVVQADIYAVGHVHEVLDFPEVRMTVTRAGKLRLVQKPLLFINCGTYLKAYATDTRP